VRIDPSAIRELASTAGARHHELERSRVIRAGIAVTALLVLAQAAAQAINFGFGLHVQALNSDVHASIFGVVSLAAQGAVAIAAGIRAAGPPRRNAWLLLSALLLVLLAVRIAIPYDATLLTAPLAVVFVLIWWLGSAAPPRVRLLIAASLALLVFSFVVHAVGLKVLSAVGYGAHGWPYEIKGIVKHSTELAGWLLLATGLLGARSEARREATGNAKPIAAVSLQGWRT
jgi:hypothetical protein